MTIFQRISRPKKRDVSGLRCFDVFWMQQNGSFDALLVTLATGTGIPIKKSDRNGMTLDFEEPLASPLQVSMRYRPWLQPFYLPIILTTLLVLGIASVFNKRQTIPQAPRT